MISKHDLTIDNIIQHPSIIDEGKDLSHIIRELKLYRIGTKDLQKMCDILFIYEQYGIPIEVKGTPNYEEKAFQQLLNGKRYINDKLKLFVPYTKIVYYSHGLEYKTVLI